MSLILEALRKSEAERRRGQVPELFDAPVTRPPAAVEPAVGPARRMPSAVVAGGAAVAAMLVLGLWWSMRDDAPAATQVDAQPAVAVDNTLPADTTPRTPRPDPQAPRAPTTTPSTTASAVPAAATPAPAPSADPTPAPISRPSSTARPLAATAPASATTTAPPAVRTAGGRVPVPPVAAPTPAAATVQPVAVPTSTNEAVREPAMLRLADLVADERRQLPTLKMSMHMWAPDRAQRFVILDGARMTEGDRVGEAVIEAITTDGAVLAWRGRQLKLPVR